MNSELTLELECDSAPFQAAVASLAELGKTSREVVQGFLGGLDSLAQLVRIDEDVVSAAGALECRIVLQPSDLFVEFLSAAGTGERDVL